MSGFPEMVVAVASVATTGTAALSAAASSAVASSAPSTSTVATGIVGFVATTVPSVVASILPSGVTTTTPVTAQIVTVPLHLELLAVLVGAIWGGVVAVERRFDIVGVFTLAIVMGLGGGIIRDLIVQKYGVAAFASNYYLAAAIAGGILAFFFASAAQRAQPWLVVIDAVSLGLFAAVGADKALYAGFKFIPAILLGTITSIGGGMIRDVLIDETPEVLRPGKPLFGFAAALGATFYVLAVSWLDITKPFAALATVVFVVLLRVTAVRRGWEAPMPRDYSDHVAGFPRRVLAWTPFYPRPDDGPGGDDEGVDEAPQDPAAGE